MDLFHSSWSLLEPWLELVYEINIAGFILDTLTIFQGTMYRWIYYDIWVAVECHPRILNRIVLVSLFCLSIFASEILFWTSSVPNPSVTQPLASTRNFFNNLIIGSYIYCSCCVTVINKGTKKKYTSNKKFQFNIFIRIWNVTEYKKLNQ